VSRVWQQSESFYRTVRALYDDSDYYARYPLTRLWGAENMKVLLDVIERQTDPADKIRAIHETFLFSVNTADDDLKRRMVDWYCDHFQARGLPIESFGPSIEESSYSNPANTVIRAGRRLAPDFLRTLILTLEIERHCRLPAARFSVLELGAGYGGLARTFALRHPDVCYVIVDIPESLYFSATFLGLNFPDARALFVVDRGALATELTAYDFVFVPALFADGLAGKDFHVFCNTASLGEMRNSVIRYWIDLVQRQASVRYFFGLNRFLNTANPQHHAWRYEENCSSVAFDRHWRILQWEVEPPFTRCPYVETEVSRNLEIVAERSHIEDDEAMARSRRLLEGVVRQDWFVYYDADNTMKLRDNVLAPDLTMTGPLFALWESIRLHANAANVTAMLKYLTTLTRGKPFEEASYYQELRDASTGRSAPAGGGLPVRGGAVDGHGGTRPTPMAQGREARDGVRLVRDRRSPSAAPLVSLILLDWSVRESFHALRWLERQSVRREDYEVIWVELYDRVPAEVLEQADVVITCGQRGLYRKHEGYNVGLLYSRGEMVTVCDSDVVFPPDFVASIVAAFKPDAEAEPRPLVLMHHEWRSPDPYPIDVQRIEDVRRYRWRDLSPNAGACLSVRRLDAIRHGGFDEDPSFRGYMCGPYDLGWRLVNAGLPEVWHDERVALWHFAHPEPYGPYRQFSLRRFFEIAQPHVEHHAWAAVEAFSTGRVLPRRENPQIHALRLSLRRIGLPFEERFAVMTGPTGFSPVDRLRQWVALVVEPFGRLWPRAKWEAYLVVRATPLFRPVRWLYRKYKGLPTTNVVDLRK
jgi:putative sugar O-methyltransferase